MKYPDIYSRCIKMDGTVDMEKLKRISLEWQEEYELQQHNLSVLRSALLEIVMKVGTVDRKTGNMRSGTFAVSEACRALDLINESAASSQAADSIIKLF